MNDLLDDRLRGLGAGLHERGATSADDLDDVYARRRRDRQRRTGIAGATLAAALLAGAAGVALRPGSHDSQSLNVGGSTAPATTGPAPTVSTTAPASTPATAPVTTAPVPPPTPTRTPPPGPTAPRRPSLGSYQPLFPFATEAEAEAWYRDPGGRQPWHASAEQTALAFTGFLGFSDIDRTYGTTYRSAADAEVTVGFQSSEGPTRVAVVHLVRLVADDGPWEVVGTEDRLGLTLDAPRYGSTVSSPVTLGGTITGVDEHIRIRAFRPGVQGPVGEDFGVPGGGERTAWTTTVSFPPGPGTVILVAFTGGHVAEVERFAVTGVRSR